MAKLKVALIAGGWSREREISLKSGENVYNGLDKAKYEVKTYDPSKDLLRLIKDSKDIDLALILLHGRKGEDGSIQGLLDLLDLPYVGSGVLASALAMNKAVSKELFRCAGLNVPKDMVIFRDQGIDPVEIFSVLGKPVVIKPVSEGSSIGVNICHTREEITDAIKDTFAMSSEVMLEEYIKGREVSCSVLGNRQPEALPVVEIIPNKEYQFFSYTAKYLPGASNEICPAPLPSDICEKAQSTAIKAHCLLRCRNYSRSDMIAADKDVYILETNTIPGMTENSIFPLAARTAGLSFSRLLDRLIELAFED
ncbi:MAG: D-alanine--D-alanine ligase [Deltaproteobacteria bacterium]|nr:MAG: D-alanine--D-alanine ligase [Deltaproteobacteria bacterium]